MKNRTTTRKPNTTKKNDTANGTAGRNGGTPLFEGRADEHLDIPTLEGWLWDAACAVRGATDAPKFKDFILPLIFYKRLSDVFDDEFAHIVAKFDGEEAAHEIVEADHRDALENNRAPIVRFYVPREFSWSAIRHHPADGRLGEFVTEAMRAVARQNPELQGVLDVKDFNERQAGQRTLDDERLGKLVEIVSRHRLGLKNAEPDILGRAYEYLLRKFAEGQGQSAGEFYTPKEVGVLMAAILDPRPRARIYDPTCGSGGLLIKARLHYERNNPEGRALAPKLFGQELNPTTYAIAKMNMFLHDFVDAKIGIGDTMRNPQFVLSGARFTDAIANPMWNQDNYGDELYDADSHGWFGCGPAPRSSADWGWAQHILASLAEDGRAAIVLDTGAVSRGSGSKSSSREREIRKCVIERDEVEGVILLPENLFYNTTAPGIILVLGKKKPAERRETVLLVNAAKFFRKEKPKNALTEEGIAAVTEIWRAWESRAGVSRVVTLDEIRAADYNLSPSQFVELGSDVNHRPLNEIVEDIDRVADERMQADSRLRSFLEKLDLKSTRFVQN